MAISKLTNEQIANLISAGIEHQLIYEIKAKVQPFRDEIVKEIDATFHAACEAAAKNIVCRVVGVNNLPSNQYELHFHFGENHGT